MRRQLAQPRRLRRAPVAEHHDPAHHDSEQRPHAHEPRQSGRCEISLHFPHSSIFDHTIFATASDLGQLLSSPSCVAAVRAAGHIIKTLLLGLKDSFGRGENGEQEVAKLRRSAAAHWVDGHPEIILFPLFLFTLSPLLVVVGARIGGGRAGHRFPYSADLS